MIAHSLSCIRASAFALSVLILSSPAWAKIEFETPVAIENVTLAPGSREAKTEGPVTILIEGGRITAIGTQVTIPPQARRLDGAGLFAYPGLIDAGSHFGLPEPPRSEEDRLRIEDEQPDVSEAVMTATRAANRRGIHPEFRPTDVLRVAKKDVERYNQAGFTHALVVPRSGLLRGTSEFLTLSDLPLRRLVLASDLAMHASFRTGEPGGYPRTLLGVMAHLRQVLLDAGHLSRVQKHAARNPSSAAPPPVDRALEALQPVLAGKQRVFFEANREREIRRVLSLADEFGLRIGITGGAEAYKVIDDLKTRGVPIIAGLDLPDRPYPEEEKGGKKKKNSKSHDPAHYESPRMQAERLRIWEEQVDNLIRLDDAGLKVAIRTTDSKDMSAFFKSLRLLIKRGLREKSAVQWLTANPASLFGMAESVGQLERNHFANLVLFDKSIADKKAKVRHVFVMGKEVDLPEKNKDKSSKSDKKNDKKELDAETSTAPEDKPTDEKEEESEPAEQIAEADKTSDDLQLDYRVEIDADRFDLPTTGGNLLITNATIIPVASPMREKSSILIRNGKIVAISDQIDAGPSVMTIDGEGLFVMPGFVDPHSHLGLDAVNEFGLSITSEVRIADVINPTEVGLYRALAGGTTTHHTMHGSANPV
ncbi:MAG: amidohydrolase family protein, partial [Phycisphaerae bacterium]